MMVAVDRDTFEKALHDHANTSGLISDHNVMTGDTDYYDAHSKVLIAQLIRMLTLRGNIDTYYLEDSYKPSKKKSPKYPGLEDYDFDSL